MGAMLQLLAKQCCVADPPIRLAVDAGAGTRTGSRRSNNEDSHYVDCDAGIFLVADGIGGEAGGELAGRIAVDQIVRHIKSHRLGLDSSEEVMVDEIRNAFCSANAAIIRAASQDAQYYRMGTTTVLALNIGPQLMVASIGDSRAYLIRGERIELLTIDHTMAQVLVEAGTISRKDALRHPWRHILSRYLGCDDGSSEPDIRLVDLQGGDRVMLATDGLTDTVDDRSILTIMQENRGAQEAAAALIEAARTKEARDDATCVVIAVEEMDNHMQFATSEAVEHESEHVHS